MRAEELIQAVEAAGGALKAQGDKLACELPQEAEHLIPELQAQKLAILEILRRRTAVPWPGYHNDQPFTCEKCNLHFDTSAGYAKHVSHVCGCNGTKFALASTAT
jgi:hypothetical protein